ncbi:hypothetical protein GJAV_G00111280 [Gymnothorax javanicus]|nr:hypothetical protein GJAV_G00111280 [Gymnothorax javanicus]
MEDFGISPVEIVCLGTSVALSGLFYYVYRKKRKTLDKLNEASRLPVDGKLADILDSAPGKCLQYVVIEGAAQPVGEPLRSQFQEGTVGVVQKLVLKEHKLVWNSFAGAWTDSERVLHERVSSVPFNLEGADGAAVRVLCPLEASGLDAEIIHEKFHQASYGFTDIVGQYLSGEKPKGQLETEEMVKVGAMLTGVGELILDTDRMVKLRPPTDGSPFFLTPADYDSICVEQKDQATLWQVLASLCALVGIAVVLWAARRYYRHLQAKREQDRLRKQFKEVAAGVEDDDSGEPPANTCIICMSEPRSCVLLDCGHVCCCFDCFLALPHPNCPVCRQPIRRVVPLYQS